MNPSVLHPPGHIVQLRHRQNCPPQSINSVRLLTDFIYGILSALATPFAKSSTEVICGVRSCSAAGVTNHPPSDTSVSVPPIYPITILPHRPGHSPDGGAHRLGEARFGEAPEVLGFKSIPAPSGGLACGWWCRRRVGWVLRRWRVGRVSSDTVALIIEYQRSNVIGATDGGNSRRHCSQLIL